MKNLIHEMAKNEDKILQSRWFCVSLLVVEGRQETFYITHSTNIH